MIDIGCLFDEVEQIAFMKAIEYHGGQSCTFGHRGGFGDPWTHSGFKRTGRSCSLWKRARAEFEVVIHELLLRAHIRRVAVD
ncbi:hypothetical protein WS89_17115 [Burkholderia sp. MSMB1072]|nr:hypothetical protein WS89_17115 [Burkholderia sp. MSMB1072]KVT06859.1 hypothetical protein WT24_20190 [Burkholderia sp. MSMB1078WGS]